MMRKARDGNVSEEAAGKTAARASGFSVEAEVAPSAVARGSEHGKLR